MIISVDTGNKQMKTENCEFNSGVEILDTLPGELEEVIEYEDRKRKYSGVSKNLWFNRVEIYLWSFLYNKKRRC